MRMLVTGVKDDKSCIIQEIDCTPNLEEISVINLLDLPVKGLPPRPPGSGNFLDMGLSPGLMRWLRIRFPAGQRQEKHHTDTIDCLTIIAGSVELILDDGAHLLSEGDSAIVNGVDHGWQTGPGGCALSLISFGTPAPSNIA